MSDAPTSPPVATRRAHLHTEHGVPRLDPYHWMHAAMDVTHSASPGLRPEFVDYLAAERAWYDATTAPLAAAISELTDEMVARLPDEESTPPWQRMRFSYYTRHRTGSSYAQLMRERRTPGRGSDAGSREPAPVADGNRAELLLDVASLADGGGLDEEYVELGLTIVSPDENWLAYSVDTSGDEVYRLAFRDLRTGPDHTDSPERIERTYYGGAWSADSRFFFYTVHDAAYRPFQLWRHRVGTDPADDILVLTEADERFELNVRATRSGDAIICWAESHATSEAWFLDPRRPERPPRSIGGRRHGVRYRAEHRRLPDGSADLLIVTNDAATEFRLMRAPLPEADQDHTRWVEARPADPAVRLLRVDAFAGGVVLAARTEWTHKLYLTGHDDLAGTSFELSSASPAGEVHLARNTAYDARSVIVRDEARLVPPCWSEVRLDGGGQRELLRRDAPSYAADRYRTERRAFRSRDGIEVPATIMRHRDTALDGSAPCLLYGYGAYGAVFEPEWDPALPSLLDRGVVYVFAHVRGGGEGGRGWHLDGKLAAKQHTFDDHIAVADGLVAAGLVDGARIATRGMSAGGLLQGAVFSQRPDRWRVVVAEVPFVDVVTTMFDDATPLTVAEREEWGDPRLAEEFAWLSAYDPMRNPPPPGTRPDLLVTGALHDPRVMIREPAKWVATLRATDPAWSSRCLMRAETGAGSHTGPSGRIAALAYEAEIYAYLLDHLADPAVIWPDFRRVDG
ncbi:MAG: prolyl oligopeptidase family serine peptidase [Nocardioides sp.]